MRVHVSWTPKACAEDLAADRAIVKGVPDVGLEIKGEFTATPGLRGTLIGLLRSYQP